MPGERWLDELARDLGATRSRRDMLRRLGALALGAVAAMAFPAETRAKDCPKGKADCGGTCANLKTDARHCGACDNACPAGIKCRKGQCRCRKGRELCGGECVNVKTDEQHCGACDAACPAGKRCGGGQCVGDCAPEAEPCGENCCAEGLTCCPGAAGGPARGGARAGVGPPRCVDLRADRANCGACGRVCGPTEDCAGGECVRVFEPCPSGWDGPCRRSQARPWCCAPGFECCLAAGCCRKEDQCCGAAVPGASSAGICCTAGTTCCFAGPGGSPRCCGPGETCCLNLMKDSKCCPAAAVCCGHHEAAGEPLCCLPGETCCIGPPGSGSRSLRCCPVGQTCVESQCV